MKTLKLSKPKKITLGKMKQKAWVEFSKYVRLSEADSQGYVTCYTCGKRALWNDGMQAGHGIGGRSGAVLFMREVVKVQCIGCNVFGRGQYRIFTRKLIDELGLEKYDELVQDSMKTVPYKVYQYELLYHEYKDRVEKLLEVR